MGLQSLIFRPQRTRSSHSLISHYFIMELKLLILFILHSAFLFTNSHSLKTIPKSTKLKTNITIIGSVFCDACSENTFSNHSYFMPGVEVLIQCKFAVNSKSVDEISVTAERTTDNFGVYKLDIPPVEGFQCRQGLEIKSFCRASLIQSSSSSCSIPGTQSSTAHVAIKYKARDICILNLNTLNFHPVKRDNTLCGADEGKRPANLGISYCFWPFFPTFGFPWLDLTSQFSRLPLPDPQSLPFSIPSWILPLIEPTNFPFPLFYSPTATPVP
ncbi:uncharacterized protein LOC110032756 [Phalaenopsis equestris]|uniref:uncharacterized protein LOC110032756 n=1 Tax=Phalaenopsis equestris TaxID=78828 RepID=UPI0009E4B83D|nr:uncharacterized protein LOC110032756 [Phalaenopsis equestris]